VTTKQIGSALVGHAPSRGALGRDSRPVTKFRETQ
jgi:hypothetical protein